MAQLLGVSAQRGKSPLQARAATTVYGPGWVWAVVERVEGRVAESVDDEQVVGCDAESVMAAAA